MEKPYGLYALLSTCMVTCIVTCMVAYFKLACTPTYQLEAD